MTEWLTDWLTDWLTVWFIVSLNNCLIDWFMIDWSIIDWWLIDWLPEYLATWLKLSTAKRGDQQENKLALTLPKYTWQGKKYIPLIFLLSLLIRVHNFAFLTETSSGLKNREMVDFILNRSLDALRDYIKCSYPDKPSRFAHILLRLPTLRGVCSKMAHECLFAQSFLNLALPQVRSFILQKWQGRRKKSDWAIFVTRPMDLRLSCYHVALATLSWRWVNRCTMSTLCSPIYRCVSKYR